MAHVVFKTKDQSFQVEITHTNIHVERILSALGNVMVKGEFDFDLLTAQQPIEQHVLISGDDSYGSVYAISVWNGHLILIASFGDDGDTLFSPTVQQGVVATNDLPSELLSIIREGNDCATMGDKTFFVNTIDDYSIGITYTIG